MISKYEPRADVPLLFPHNIMQLGLNIVIGRRGVNYYRSKAYLLVSILE